MDNLAQRTDVPGKFFYTSKRECAHTHTGAGFPRCLGGVPTLTPPSPPPPSGSDSDNSMIIVDAKYDQHILVHVIKTKGEDVSVVNKLYGGLLLLLAIG